MNLALAVWCLFITTCVQASSSDGKINGVTDRYISIDDNTPGADHCYTVPECDSNYKYRRADGRCNNLENPLWGSTNLTFIRLQKAKYDDGNHEFRKSVSGKDLPNVRLISRTLFPDINIPDKVNSLLLMQWGQILTHDSASTDFTIIPNCCPNGQFPDPPIPKCYPISIPPGDVFYSRYNVTCMTYTRVITVSEAQNCSMTPQQTSSDVTQWLDLSLMYGSNLEDSNSVRELKGGKLKLEEGNNGDTALPVTHEAQDLCRITSSKQSCLNTGDDRVNQNPGIGVMTLIITREHNRLAEELSKLNPNWDNEKLYQEARRINIAQYHHITYHEYLEHVLEKRYINGMNLASLKSSYTEYNSKIRGGTLNEFTGSIFRTFHSTVQGDLKLVGGGNGRCPMKEAKIGDNWWTSGDLVLECFEELAEGLLAQQARLYFNYFTNQETELFQRGLRPYGDDMESYDIMRGRDVGLSTYNQYRKICGLSTFSSFKQLETVMDKKVVGKLKSLYEDVEDIDMYVGAIFEKPVTRGLIGLLGQCIMAQQFARWKFGDRFFYEHKDQAGSFTKEQLKNIKKVTVSSLMCRNTKMTKIQKKGFNQVSSSNPVIPCEKIPSLDLSPWKQ